MNAKELMCFRSMITPTIIHILFWVGAVLCVLVGLVEIIAGVAGKDNGGMLVLRGLITMILGPIFVRVYCELVMLAFKMYDSLKVIEQNTGGKICQEDKPAV